jgi:hypothetical protein
MSESADYVGYCKRFAAQCPGPEACGANCKRDSEDAPLATFLPSVCQECDNEVEGVCSACDAHICGSCFNEVHGPAPIGREQSDA